MVRVRVRIRVKVRVGVRVLRSGWHVILCGGQGGRGQAKGWLAHIFCGSG